MNAVTHIDKPTIAPLDTLYHHTTNPRQTHNKADIIGLAQSISTVGLLQNLSGFHDPAQSGIGIVAGGRRLAALRHIAENPDDFADGVQINMNAIPLIITKDPALARSWAGAEAATQRALHPADEIRAYGAMISESHDVTAIARAFGCTVQHVKRRLKLADLPHDTLTALRADEITLDAAAVLTFCTSPEQHAEMLTRARRGNRPEWIKDDIMNGRIPGTDYRAIFVGAVRYINEGGTVEEDLFTEKMIFADETLLDKIFKQKLTSMAEQVKVNEGLGQTIPIFENYVSYSHTQDMDRAHRHPVDLPDADANELEALHEQSEWEELTQEQLDRMAELEERAQGCFSDDDIANGTAFVYVDRAGELKTDMLYLRRAGKGSTSENDDTANRVPDKPAITQTGMDDLKRLQLLALQSKVIDKPDLVLDLLAFQFAIDIPAFCAPFNITTHDQPNTPSCTDEVTIDQRLSDDSNDKPEDDFAAFKALGKAHRNKVLALALTRTLNQPFASPINAGICQALDVSVREVWTPTAANHFKACSTSTLDAAWRELACVHDDTHDEDMARFSKLKKGQKAKELEALLTHASVREALKLDRDQGAAIDNWVPVVLRGEG